MQAEASLERQFFATWVTILFSTLNYVQAETGQTSNLVETQARYYNGFAELMEDENTLPVQELADLEIPVMRVALYHTEDRLYKKIPKSTETMIEGMIIKKLIDTEKFLVTECVECKLIQVKLQNDQLSINQAIESNKDMRNLARKLQVDGFFMWSANVYEEKFTVDMRLVDATDNHVVWTRQYARKTNPIELAKRDEELNEEEFDRVDWELFVGAWGFSAEREGTGVSDRQLSSVTTFGIRRREHSELNEDISYGLGFETFSNLAQTDYFDMLGFVIEGRVEVNISALEQWVPTLMYLELGQAFFKEQQSLVYKYGIEFPFTRNGYIDLGVIYLPEQEVEWKEVDGLEESSEFGGASYDITLGYRF